MRDQIELAGYAARKPLPLPRVLSLPVVVAVRLALSGPGLAG